MRRRRQHAALSLRFEDWPQADRDAWDRAVEDGGLFEEPGLAAHWSPSTRRTAQYNYGLWLRWCQQEKLLTPCLAASRATQERVARYLAALEARVSLRTRHGYLGSLYRALQALYPGEDRPWLREWLNRLERQLQPGGHKPRGVRDGSELLALGMLLMREAPTLDSNLSPGERLAAAVQYRDGLMIALLACRPLRRRNFASIRLGEHLIWNDSRWWLCFSERETKQRQPIEQSFPGVLEEPLGVYLATYRPCFPSAGHHSGLWASAKGGPLRSDGVYQRIVQRTTAAFGQPVSPHRFRDSAATTLARHSPEQVLAATRLLGHSRLDTTERYYNRAGTVSASRAYQASLLALRARIAEKERR